MRRAKKNLIVFALAMLGCLAGLFVMQMKQENSAKFCVKVRMEGNDETIFPWIDNEGNYYVFLPGCADISTSRFEKRTSGVVFLNGQELRNETSCADFELDTPYEMEYNLLGERKTCSLVFVQSANVAAMHVDTASGNMEYIHAEKGNKETGYLRLYKEDGTLDYAGELESINGRGNATWMFQQKKPYSLKIQGEANLLGMGAAQRWVLLANAYDASGIRNKMAYEYAAEIGLEYSPDTAWVDLYLNGEYAGLYLLSERNEIHAERVNVSSEKGYLVSMELEDRLASQNYSYVSTKEKQALRIHDPDNADQSAQKIVLDVFQSVENAILADDGIDAVTGKHWRDLIDIDSWARKYLMEEIFASVDASFISQYFYFENGESNKKVYAGPVWDFDVILGSGADWQVKEPQAFYANRLFVRETNSTPWFHELCQKEEFHQRVVELYRTELIPLLKDLLENKMDEYALKIKAAIQMDHMRWDIDQSLAAETENMKQFLQKRITFLSSVWLEGKQYCQVCVNPGNNNYYAYYAVEPGECFAKLPELSDSEYHTFLGWYYVDTNEPFDSSAPITEDTEIYAKWADSAYKKKEQILKLIPLAVIACMGVGILWADIRRSRKGG